MKEIRYNGSEYPITADVDDVISVAELIYSDHMAENPAESEWSKPDAYVPDFHFAPCTKDLPYVK